MACRIDEFVVKGEIDNRTRGRVTGRIWFVGREEPVELDLLGNCWRDLAGRRLMFSNPERKAEKEAGTSTGKGEGLWESFAQRQEGVAGDITASRKVKVPDIPLEQIGEYYEARKPFPWHWGNALYLEWFGARNGRVVIETASFELTVTGEPVWEMTAEEEETQRAENAQALPDFLKRLGGSGAVVEEEIDTWDAGDGGVDEADESDEASGEDAETDEDDEDWQSIAPQTEAEAEAMQARSDLLADRIEARMRKVGKGADYAQILEEEIERMRRERGEPGPTPEQLERNAEWIEEMNRAADEALKNPDSEVIARLEEDHPLAEQAFELSVELHRLAEAENWIPEDATHEHPAAELVAAMGSAGTKLAGALNRGDWPPQLEFCAGTLVRLKRARGYLDDALAAAECCREEKMIPAQRVDEIVPRLKQLAEETEELIAALRVKLERGTD